ncbi:MAG: pyridoxamine 5'-phosphate oxidase family protein [Cryobacterium sp.]
MTDSLRKTLRALPDFPDNLPEFNPLTASADPIELFRDWLGQALAADLPQPHAFSLATSTPAGGVSSRMLILKDISGPALLFASARGSRKGEELSGNPVAAMNFYWHAFGRQVRFVGPVSMLPAADSAADWNDRPGADGSENPMWQVYALIPQEAEFWQARADRRHVRHRYAL